MDLPTPKQQLLFFSHSRTPNPEPKGSLPLDPNARRENLPSRDVTPDDRPCTNLRESVHAHPCLLSHHSLSLSDEYEG